MTQVLQLNPDTRQRVVGLSAKPMFWLSLTFLACLACLIVLWVDVPNLREKALGVGDQGDPVEGQRTLESIALAVILFIWPLVIAESVFHWCTRPWDKLNRKYHGFGLMHCICPPLRMCSRSPEMRDRIWLPLIGWRRSNKRLRRRLERTFSFPMIVIAMMILPILVVEFFLKDQVAQYGWLRFALHVGTGVIWFAFAAEFIVMVSIADKKLAYCKKHWIDLAIILLPLFSFLRSLRAMRATRLANIMRVPQITKMARVYRLRGTAVKAVRGLILLDVLHRWKVFKRWSGRNSEKRINRLRRRLAEVEDEAKAIRRKITQLEKASAMQESSIEVNSRKSASSTQ